MSRFTVEWSPEAEDQLAAIWLRTAPADRPSVNAAQNRIDHDLAADPLGRGTLIAEDLYSIHVSPLKGYFEIDIAALLVRVTAVAWLI
jgi:hypothetical protein